MIIFYILANIPKLFVNEKLGVIFNNFCPIQLKLASMFSTFFR